jgi:hypothetical protein
MSDSRKKRWDQNAKRFAEEVKRIEAKRDSRNQADPAKMSGDQQEQRWLAQVLYAARDANPADSQKEPKR